MTNQELTLFTIAGKRCPIYTLPEREPFMLASDLAEVYGTEYRRVTEAVKRNPERFPEDFAFHLEREDTDRLPQNASTSPGKRTDLRQLVLTHPGAYALSAVLKTPTAASVSVEVHRAFAEMERRAFADVKFMLEKLRQDTTCNKPIYMRVMRAAQYGWTFEQLFQSTNYTRKRLEAAVKELVGMGVLSEPLAGMQRDLFANV